MTSTDTLGRLASRPYPAAKPDGVVVVYLQKNIFGMIGLMQWNTFSTAPNWCTMP